MGKIKDSIILYYDDFVIALYNQSSSTDNTIEREMEYKFRQAIEKAKK